MRKKRCVDKVLELHQLHVHSQTLNTTSQVCPTKLNTTQHNVVEVSPRVCPDGEIKRRIGADEEGSEERREERWCRSASYRGREEKKCKCR